MATKSGKSCVVAVLLGAGADAKKVDSEGRKPLDVVQKGRCPEYNRYVQLYLFPTKLTSIYVTLAEAAHLRMKSTNVDYSPPSEPVCPRT